jgi:hypothetical protein
MSEKNKLDRSSLSSLFKATQLFSSKACYTFGRLRPYSQILDWLLNLRYEQPSLFRSAVREEEKGVKTLTLAEILVSLLHNFFFVLALCQDRLERLISKINSNI